MATYRATSEPTRRHTTSASPSREKHVRNSRCREPMTRASRILAVRSIAIKRKRGQLRFRVGGERKSLQTEGIPPPFRRRGETGTGQKRNSCTARRVRTPELTRFYYVTNLFPLYRADTTVVHSLRRITASRWRLHAPTGNAGAAYQF